MKREEFFTFEHDGVVHQYHHDCDVEFVDNEIYIMYKKKPTDKRIACDSFSFENELQAQKVLKHIDDQILAIESLIFST